MKSIIKSTTKWVRKHECEILTGVSLIGLVATAVTSSKASIKAQMLLDQNGKENTTIDKIKIYAKAYAIPTAICLTTGTSIIGIDVLNKKRQASLLSAYALLNGAYKKYKNKIIELYGKEVDEKVEEEVIKDDVKAIEELNVHTSRSLDGEFDCETITFYDEISGIMFESTVENVLRAELLLNQELIENMSVSIKDWHRLLGLDTKENNDYGWSTDDAFDAVYWIEFKHTKEMIDDDMEYYIISPLNRPHYLEDYDYIYPVSRYKQCIL